MSFLEKYLPKDEPAEEAPSAPSPHAGQKTATPRLDKYLPKDEPATAENGPQDRLPYFTGLNQSVPDYGVNPVEVITWAAKNSPVGLAVRGSSALWKKFQGWAQNGGFNDYASAAEAYAKEKPAEAQELAKEIQSSARLTSR